MKHQNPYWLGLALLPALAPAVFAQTIDWGLWSSGGNALYDNGDHIAITSVLNGTTAITASNETQSAHTLADPAFPYANFPGVHEYGFFRNAARTTTSWSMQIDLSSFTLEDDTVIGFSNLDGRSYNNLALPGYAVLQFLDAAGQPVSVLSADFVGAFDYTWQGVTWDATSTFDLSTQRWSVIPDVGSAHPPGSYFGAVGNAFFLTGLSPQIDRIIFTKYGGTNYVSDSVVFYAGQVVPEPACAMLIGIGGIALLFRRGRKRTVGILRQWEIA